MFTASACGDDRLDELFGEKDTYIDVKLFVENPNESLIDYFNQNDFECRDDGGSDETCGDWYNEGPVSLDTMVGLRQWSDMVIGSDCTHCG